VIDALEVERREASEFALPKRWPNVSAQQRLVIAGRLRSELWLDGELKPAVEVLIESQLNTVEFPAPVKFFEPGIQVVLCRAETAADGAVQVLPSAGLLIATEI
jgi:hypothetical protein